MIEYQIWGTSRDGRVFPANHGMTTFCAQHVIDEYKKKYPDVVHVSLDIALDDTKLLKGN